jgi:hypothetical protein
MSLADAMMPTLLEAVPDGVIVTNTERRIVEVNARAAAMFGYRRDELLGQLRDACIAPGSSHVTGHPGLRLYVGHRKDRGHFPVEVDVYVTETTLGALDIAVIRRVVERPARRTPPGAGAQPGTADGRRADLVHEANQALGILCSRIEVMQMEAEHQGGCAGRARDDLAVLYRSVLRLARAVEHLAVAPPPGVAPPRAAR